MYEKKEWRPRGGRGDLRELAGRGSPLQEWVMTLVRWWWLGGTSPAGQGVSRKTAQRAGALRRRKKRRGTGKRVKLGEEAKQWRFGRDCSCTGQGKKTNNSNSFSSSKTSLLVLRIKYPRSIEFIYFFLMCVFWKLSSKPSYFKRIVFTIAWLLP